MHKIGIYNAKGIQRSPYLIIIVMTYLIIEGHDWAIINII